MVLSDLEPLIAKVVADAEEQPKNARDRSRIETRRRLMSAWLDLAGKNNPANVSIRDIAAKAQVSVGAFYCHFKDKDALSAEVAVDCLAKLVVELDRLSANTQPDIETAHATALLVLIDFAERNPQEARFIFRVSSSETDLGRQFLSLWQEFWDQRVEPLMTQMLAELPVDPALDKAVLARATWGLAERVLSWWLANQASVSKEAVVRTLARFVAKGMAPLPSKDESTNTRS
jgi:AcrR family transcriptional regulator